LSRTFSSSQAVSIKDKDISEAQVIDSHLDEFINDANAEQNYHYGELKNKYSLFILSLSIFNEFLLIMPLSFFLGKILLQQNLIQQLMVGIFGAGLSINF